MRIKVLHAIDIVRGRFWCGGVSSREVRSSRLPKVAGLGKWSSLTITGMTICGIDWFAVVMYQGESNLPSERGFEYRCGLDACILLIRGHHIAVCIPPECHVMLQRSDSVIGHRKANRETGNTSESSLEDATGLRCRFFRFERNSDDMDAQLFDAVAKDLPKLGCDGVHRVAVRGVQQEDAQVGNSTVQLTAVPPNR